MFMKVKVTYKCAILQVLAFREKKLEALKLQAAIAFRQQKEEEEMAKAAEEKEKQRREKIQRKVKKRNSLYQ